MGSVSPVSNQFETTTIVTAAHLVNLLADIDKSRILKALLVLFGRSHQLAEPCACVADQPVHLQHVLCLFDGLVVAADKQVGICEFKPSTGRQVREGLRDEAIVVGHRSLQVAGVDEIEWLGVFPVRLKIVHLEGEVRGDPGRILTETFQ